MGIEDRDYFQQDRKRRIEKQEAKADPRYNPKQFRRGRADKATQAPAQSRPQPKATPTPRATSTAITKVFDALWPHVPHWAQIRLAELEAQIVKARTKTIKITSKRAKRSKLCIALMLAPVAIKLVMAYLIGHH